jgi:hypothetical protein
MRKSKWIDFISISFIIYFSPKLYQNIEYFFLYLLFGDHPRAWIHIKIQNVIYVLLLEFLFLKIDSEV